MWEWEKILETQIIGIMVGAVITSLGGAWIVHLLDLRKLKKSYLLDQVQKIYAPLHFFVGQFELYWDLLEKLEKAYIEEYENGKWSEDEEEMKRANAEITQYFNIRHEYFQIIKQNNKKICKILRNNYGYIDWDDLEIFHGFVVNDVRSHVEFDEDGKLIIPRRIHSHLKKVFHIKNISCLPPEFADRVKDKFGIKKIELEGKK